MTPLGLWLRVCAGTALAVGSLVLLPVRTPSMHLSIGTAGVLGCVGGACLFAGLARKRPQARLDGWSRRDWARSSFLVLWAGVEEAIWRRLALGAIALHTDWATALAASTVAFAVTHRSGRSTQLVTGLAFGSIYVLTGQLVAAIAMHAVYNLLLDRALGHRPSARPA